MTIKFKSAILILILTLLVPLVLSAASATVGGRRAALVGGWRQIKNLNAPEVQYAAQFAVTEHNKEAAGANLVYQKVVNGETQVVAGTNYRLVIAAKDGGVSGNYEAVVWVKPWAHFKNLTSFRKVAG